MEQLELVRQLAREQGLSDEEVERVLEFIANPTVRPIVGVREFCESPYYMGATREDGTSVIWPKVMDELERMNDGSYDTVVLTGSIGSAKTTAALYSLAYQLYLLSCYEDPHKLYELDPASEIVFIFQSVTAKAAKDVDYQRFRAMVEKAPYFREHFSFNKDFESEIKFPKRIIVRPVSSKDTAAIGQNVFGGLIDEVNFMAITEKSKLSATNEAYDQAEALYNSIASRRASRFGRLGVLPGLLCLVSSAKYPGQFTDKRIAEAEAQIAKDGKTHIFIYNKRMWDVAPEGRFCGQMFPIFIGDNSHQPRIMTQEEASNPREWEKGLVDWIPVEFRHKFEQDMMGSLRDIAGRSTIAKFPFFIELDRVSSCLGRAPNVLSKTKCTLVPREDEIEALPQDIRNKKSPRFAHVDLAISGDSAGLCIGHVEKFLEVQRDSDQFEVLPKVVIDVILEIPPPKNGEILFYRIRELIYNLKEILGMPIQWVTFDSFQSKDSMQLLRQRGFTTGLQSMDLLPCDPYAFLKSAFYDGRIEVPQCKKLLKELGALEKDSKTGKLDHPPGGSKDLADALAGVCYGLHMRREIWAHFGVPLRQAPGWIIKRRLQEVAATAGEGIQVPLPQ